MYLYDIDNETAGDHNVSCTEKNYLLSVCVFACDGSTLNLTLLTMLWSIFVFPTRPSA